MNVACLRDAARRVAYSYAHAVSCFLHCDRY